MRRRRFAHLVAAFALLPIVTSVGGDRVLAARAQPPAGRPNIFMIFADDVTARDLGPYGNKAVRTPNLDRLANQGLRFTNMYAASPSCSPSRAVLLTGLYPNRNGGHPNHSAVKPGTKSMAHYMASLGYRVILMGKVHASPRESFPFEFYEDDELKPGIGTTKMGSELRTVLAGVKGGGKPVCILYAKFSTHYPWPPVREYHYEPSEVALQPYLVDTPETRQMRAAYYTHIEDMDRGVGQVMALLEEYKLADDMLTIYSADHGSGWPHERDMLYGPGIHAPFIARWPGKIAPGTVTDALASLVDIVPTFIEVAGGDVSAVVSKNGGAALDGRSFLPVLLGRQREHHEAIFASHTSNVMSVYPIRAVRTRTHSYIWNIDALYEFPSVWSSDAPSDQFTSRLPVWRSWIRKAATDPFAAERVRMENERPPEELYDLVNDPFELKNLAEDPTHAPMLRTMRGKLEAWMKQQGDAGDSAYHKDVEAGRHFPDEVFHRQKAVVLKVAVPRSIISDHAARIELLCPVWTAEIHYTLDGSTPTERSPRYTAPLTVQAQTVIKARAFWPGSRFWPAGATPVKELNYTGPDFRFLYEGHVKPVYH